MHFAALIRITAESIANPVTCEIRRAIRFRNVKPTDIRLRGLRRKRGERREDWIGGSKKRRDQVQGEEALWTAVCGY